MIKTTCIWYSTSLYIITTNLHCSTIFMITFTTPSSGRELGESVIFQLVLKAYLTRHPWIITAHISLGHLEHHWKAFNRQLIRTHGLLQFLSQQPSAPTQLISTLHIELSNIDDLYNSCKPTIISAFNLLNTNPSLDRKSQSHPHHKKEFTTIPRRCTQMAYGNCNYKGCK